MSQKVKVAVDAGFTPILCVGETLAAKEKKKKLCRFLHGNWMRCMLRSLIYWHIL